MVVREGSWSVRMKRVEEKQKDQANKSEVRHETGKKAEKEAAEIRGLWLPSDQGNRREGTRQGPQKSGPTYERSGLSFAFALSSSRPPRESGLEREMEVARQPCSPSFRFWFLRYLPSFSICAFPPTLCPLPRPLVKFHPPFSKISGLRGGQQESGHLSSTPPGVRLQLRRQ